MLPPLSRESLPLPSGASDSQNAVPSPSEIALAGSPPEARKPDLEDALESHEVIELQAFIERKAWIEEKIQFLHSLPPVEVFAGVNELSEDANEVHGLATRTQLEDWLLEHDRIEKETEIFDSGDLKKLKRLTKAATQRNLSPEDTDLIELTLTTLLTLDRLLHLLRDRSDNLDLLGVRLIWEEHRLAAWSDRSRIIEDLRGFLNTRARWSPSAYNVPTTPDVVPLGRRGSVASVASVASDSSAGTSLGFSRGVRYKLAEVLSRDAAQFASRVTALKHGMVAASGKTLDKLIDDSRQPVPEPILDEQDRLEDKCGKEMENIGKFAMNVVMQWKKADEIYIETKKDQGAARNLIEEIELAQLHHPTSRQDVSYISRAEVLMKRLSVRSNPASSTTSFPRPTHQLFPDQAECNDAMVTLLSSELDLAFSLGRKAEDLAKYYHTTWNAVKGADSSRVDLADAQSKLKSVSERFQRGFSTENGDGEPPDLTDTTCLESPKSSAYLAMLPSMVDDLRQCDQAAERTLQVARVALSSLNRFQINNSYVTAFRQEIEALSSHRKKVATEMDEMLIRVGTLRELKRIWSCVVECLQSLDVMGSEMKDAIAGQRWRQQISGNDIPMTPESPRPLQLSVDSTPDTLTQQLVHLNTKFVQDIDSPLRLVSSTLAAPLAECLDSIVKGLAALIADARDMADIWADIQRQSVVMETVRDEVNVLEAQIEEIRLLFDKACHDVVSETWTDEDLSAKEADLLRSKESIRYEVDKFIENLAVRIPFISRQDSRTSHPSTISKRLLQSMKLHLRRVGKLPNIVLPFDPSAVDRAVRADSNAYSMRLVGGIKLLEQMNDLLDLGKLAREVDHRLSSTLDDVQRTAREMEIKKQLFREGLMAKRSTLDDCSRFSESLTLVTKDIEEFSQASRSRIAHSLTPIRELISRIRSGPGTQDETSRSNLLKPRNMVLDDVNLQIDRLNNVIESLKTEITEAESALKIEQDILLEEEQRDAVVTLIEASSDVAVDDQTKEDVHSVEARGTQAENVGSPLLNSRDTGAPNDEDVYSLRVATYPKNATLAGDTGDLMNQIRSLRKRLKSLGINNVARPPELSQPLPTEDQAVKMAAEFSTILKETESFPASANEPPVEMELLSLRAEVHASVALLHRVEQLAKMSASIDLCDATLSDLLDHIDSYPSVPPSLPVNSHTCDPTLSPQEQLAARVSFTKGVVGDMNADFAAVVDDSRATAEHGRLMQTWNELIEMATDHISGAISRPVSVYSSGRNSSASATSTRSTEQKRGGYSKLSLGSNARGGFLAPVSSRRSLSSSNNLPKQSPSNLTKVASNRIASGPLSSSSSLFSSTFASRQRTASLASTTSSVVTPVRLPHRSQVGRSDSPAPSETSSISRIGNATRPSSSFGTWSRAARQSFDTVPKMSPPRDKGSKSKPVRQKYVANPKNRLDMAVGDVVNKLPVNINVEIVADTWKDKSGKYWIGDNDPKLCFCRILRSQTVMVRVGGGWTELSKFIQTHFADAFRLIPESPPRTGSKEEKWISSSTLFQTQDNHQTPPRTPEPHGPFVPSFALSTPNDMSPRSLRSGSSSGSPLTPLQFMRRADVDGPGIRPVTPSKGPALRPKSSATSNHVQSSVWRP